MLVLILSICEYRHGYVMLLKDVKADKMNCYSANYRYVLKDRIIVKRKTLTNDVLLINEVLDKLQSL